MQTTASPTAAAAPMATAAASGSVPRQRAGTLAMLGAALSNQFGAAAGTLAFPVIGPLGVVAVRQWIAAAVLLAAGRPRWRTFTWSQWWPVLLLAVLFGTMNLSLYTAIDRLGLGLAVTLEFLGPLGVALATSRRRADLACALVAGAGVVALTRPRPATDYVGIGLGLLAAACWAGYILTSRLVGRRVPGAQGPATAAVLSALVFVPAGLVDLVRHPPTVTTLACAAAAGVLASAVPLLADLFALRRVPAHFFGMFMSVNPVVAAITGLAVLGQSLTWTAWLSIAAIVGANAASAVPGTAAVRPHGPDHGGRDDERARDPGRAQPLPQDERGQDGAGQRLEQAQQSARAGGGGPQPAEVQRVGDRGRAAAQRDHQAGRGRPGGEAESARRLGQRHQSQPADGEAEPGHGQVVQPGYRPRAGQGERGEAAGGQDGHARARQHGGPAVSGRQADQQAQPGQGQAGGDGCVPAGRTAGEPVRGQHQDRRGTNGDQGGQRNRGQGHGGEVAALIERGQQADHGNPGPGGPAHRPAPAGHGQDGHDQQAARGQAVSRDRDRGQAGGPGEQAAGQPAGAPQ